MGLALLIIGLVLGCGCFGYFIYTLVKFTKSHVIGEKEASLTSEDNKKYIALMAAQGLLVILSTIGLVVYKQWPLAVWEYFLLVIGCFAFGVGFDMFYAGFVLYYWRTDMVEKQRKFCRKITFISIAVIVVGLIMLTEGFARHCGVLPSGISFTQGLIYPHRSSTGFQVKFYGILIVLGACLSYVVCDHYFFKKFKEHGLIDTLFIFAFLCGVIGARLWYCFVLEPAKYIANPGEIIKIFEGGMAIQGGAIAGIIGGVAFVLIFRKYVDIRFAMDVAIPSILLAQVVGRWGNFFNQEVYGKVISEQALYWLPTIVRNNMFVSGEYRVPLFLIEGIINLGGYFFIRYFLGKKLKMHIGLGYQASFYLIWYGMVRAVLEPLREGFTLNMGSSEAYGYMQSWIIAFAMIGAGIVMLLAFYFVHRYRMKNKLEDEHGDKVKAL